MKGLDAVIVDVFFLISTNVNDVEPLFFFKIGDTEEGLTSKHVASLEEW